MPQSLLEKIDAADYHVRLYALNGLAVSLASEIEDTMFWCFVASTGEAWEAAVDRFYEKVNFSRKCTLTNNAVAAKVLGTHQQSPWAVLNERILELLGEGRSDRNLVSHNAVRLNTYVHVPPEQEQPPNAIVRVVPEVRQNVAMIARRGRIARTVSFGEMRDYCSKLIELYRDLERFADQCLGFGPDNPLRRERQ